MAFFAHRLDHIKPSATLATMALAQRMKADGVDMIILAAGELDFPTPDWIQYAAIQAMEQGLTRYTAVDGIANLKLAIQSKFMRHNKLTYDMNQIMVSSGGKQVLFNAMMCTINTDDEVIIPAPYWVSYGDVVALFGGKPVFIETNLEQRFKVTPEQLQAHITPKTKWLILNSPSNPTGSIYSKDELSALASVLAAHPHVYVLSDDIYEHLTYDVPFCSILNVAPHLKERTLILNGFSKAYAMTGWRLGYAAGPRDLIKAMTVVQSQSTTNANAMAQGAGIIALNGSMSYLTPWKEELVKRRDMCVEKLNQIPGLSCIKPEGAFYIFVSCELLIGKSTPQGKVLTSDQDICTYFLNYGVAVVPGAAFGLSPYFRISFASAYADLEKAIERIANAIKNLI